MYSRAPVRMTSQPPDPNLDELIQRAKAGDMQARDKLFKSYKEAMSPLATRVIARYPHLRIQPSDIVQEASLRASRSLAQFEGQTGEEWDKWLYTIVINCSRQALRDARRKKRDPDDLVWLDAPEQEVAHLSDSPSASTAVEERWHQIFSAIYELSEDQRDAIWLFHLKKLRVAQVAETLGKTENQVAGLLQRGMVALRNRFAAESSQPPGLATDSAQRALTAAWTEYLWLRESGQAIDTGAFIAEHAHIADELRSLLAWVMRIEALELKNSDEND